MRGCVMGIRKGRWVLASLAIFCGVVLFLPGCSSAPVNVFPLPPKRYEVLGPVAGIGCGNLVLLGEVVNFVPVKLNSHLQRAYRQAIGTIPGTTSLINVDVREDWFWWVLGTTRCTLITGDAIREVKR